MAVIPLYGRDDFLDRKRRLAKNHEAVVEKLMGEKIMPGEPTHYCDLWHAVSPLDRVRHDAPPMLIEHGTGDTMMPYGDARDFAGEAATTSGSRLIYVELRHIQHA